MLEGPQIEVAVERELDFWYLPQWLPCSSRLLITAGARGFGAEAGVYDLRQPDDQFEFTFRCPNLRQDTWEQPRAFSHSQLFMADLGPIPSVVSLESGEPLWAAAAQHSKALPWLSFLPSGCGIISAMAAGDGLVLHVYTFG